MRAPCSSCAREDVVRDVRDARDAEPGGVGPGFRARKRAARYSTLDPISNGSDGGEEDNWTLAVNWYLNPNMRWMVNYTLAQIEHVFHDGDRDILQTRFQGDF